MTAVLCTATSTFFFRFCWIVDSPLFEGQTGRCKCHSQGGQGGSSSTSEIASSSYEARSFGVKNGMRCEILSIFWTTADSRSKSLQRARHLCPDLITIPYEFER